MRPSLPPRPQIAALQPSVSITLQALGKLDHIAACTRYCLDVVPELANANIPIVSDSWSTSDAELAQLAALDLDLVIVSVPYREQAFASLLKSGLRVLALAPHSLADIYGDIHAIAAAVNAHDQAEFVTKKMQSHIDQVHSRVLALDDPLVYCEEWGKPLIHSQLWVAELVNAAGGTFLNQPGAHTSAEIIAAANPDVLCFAWCGAGDRVPLDRIIEQRNWADLAAVRNRRVYCIPDEFLNTPAPILTAGLDCLAAAIHPEIFPAPPRLKQLATKSERAKP
jgi:iron complex transport system substrate-binding protein